MDNFAGNLLDRRLFRRALFDIMTRSVILDNIEKIRFRASAAALRAGRDPNGVRLIAVTKYAAPEDVRRLLESGAVDEVGESRVQDALSKKEQLGALAGKVRWRLIGHLQTNKARKAVEAFDRIDSIDAERTAEALERALAGEKRRLPVLAQVKLSERQTQSGVAPENLEALLKALAAYPHLEVRGLMGIAPNVEPLEAVRPYFRSLRRLHQQFFSDRPDAELSMGMSRDLEIAVEEGATHIRVGTALFS